MLVKRAYADWSRYRDARHELQTPASGSSRCPPPARARRTAPTSRWPSTRWSSRTAASTFDNFVIVSGDSDFTPLVGKLRELNKRVIGVGNRESASDLLVANCDEFIYYDSLAARVGIRRKLAPARQRQRRQPGAASAGDADGAAARGHRVAARERGQGLHAAQVPGLRRDRPRLLDLLEAAGGGLRHGGDQDRDRPAQRHVPRGAGRDHGGGAGRRALRRAARRAVRRARLRRRRGPPAPAPRRPPPGVVRAGVGRGGRGRGRGRGRRGGRGLRGRGQAAAARPRPGHAAAARPADLLRGHDHARPRPRGGRGQPRPRRGVRRRR